MTVGNAHQVFAPHRKSMGDAEPIKLVSKGFRKSRKPVRYRQALKKQSLTRGFPICPFRPPTGEDRGESVFQWTFGEMTPVERRTASTASQEESKVSTPWLVGRTHVGLPLRLPKSSQAPQCNSDNILGEIRASTLK